MSAEVVCQNCKEQYSYDLIVPDSIWEKISPKPVEGYKGGGLLCPECIVEKMVDYFDMAKEAAYNIGYREGYSDADSEF